MRDELSKVTKKIEYL